MPALTAGFFIIPTNPYDQASFEIPCSSKHFISINPCHHMEQNTPLPGDGLEKLMTALIA
jgi:hypothetical protein